MALPPHPAPPDRRSGPTGRAVSVVARKVATKIASAVVPILAVALLVVGAAGRLPDSVALALGVGITAWWAAVRLLRPARFLGLGAVAAGLTGVMPLVSPPAVAVWTTAGFGLAVALFSVGSLLLPGAGRCWTVHTRRAFDGVGLGVSLTFAGYLAPPTKHGSLSTLPLLLLGATGMAIATVTLLRGRPPRRAAALCGSGVILVLLGLAALNLLLLTDGATLSAATLSAATLSAAGLPTVLGLALTVAGTRRSPTPAAAPLAPSTAAGGGAPARTAWAADGGTPARTASAADGGAPARTASAAGGGTPARTASATADGTRVLGAEPDSDQYLASYPLLAVPAAVGVVAAVWHLIAVRTFDTTGIILGIAMVAVLAMRELLVVRDIRRYAGRLQTAEAHFRSLVAGATDLTLVLDAALRVRWQSPAASRLFGLTDAEVVGRTFVELIHPEDVNAACETIDAVLAGPADDGPPALVIARLRDGADRWRETESTIADQRSVPEVAALVVHVRDIGERRQLERTLHQLSWTDQLTGLANLRALMRTLLAYRRRAGQQGTLLVIDLHGVAEINDSLGREVGDAVLIEVGRRIRRLLGPDDVAARLGGDEFAVLTGDGAVLAYTLAARITRVLAEPIELPGVLAELHTSIGLAELAGRADSEEVLRNADLARKRARQFGTDRVEWYDPDVEIQLNRRMDLEQQVLRAAERGQLDLVFQPVVTLPDRQPVGVEALLRWRHPELGTILPNELLPIARAVGIAAELDEWVLTEACKHLAAWSTGDTSFWLSVNISPRELLTARFPERVAKVLQRHGLAPDRLIVEVAEDWIAEDVPAIVAALAGLRKMGVRAALDDFGAGQASLSHLRRLPVDMLKLDASLVNGAAEADAAGGPRVLDVVVSLGRRLGLSIVAKGLESEDQIERAAQAGCPYGQGFALTRPAPAERIEAYLETHRA